MFPASINDLINKFVFNLNQGFLHVFFVGIPFEKNTDRNVWIMYKEALEEESIFRQCWNMIIEDLRQSTPQPDSILRSTFEEFASMITGLWAMYQGK